MENHALKSWFPETDPAIHNLLAGKPLDTSIGQNSLNLM
jgi:hypothetical protein